MKNTKFSRFLPKQGGEWFRDLKKMRFFIHTTELFFIASLLFMLIVPLSCRQNKTDNSYEGIIRKGNVGGYTIVYREDVDESYNAGFSLYATAWPLLREYPGRDFQSGLFGTWMHAQLDKPAPIERMYSDIEGGLGWWRSTEFPTETPKFIMGGVELNFVAWANGPGAGKGRDWSKPKGKYGVAQLSPWLLFPPDGLNLKQGTCGELFGYGYLPLPLTDPKSVTAGKNVPTGNQCWTLFINTGNFKGPVAFFTPYFWSRPSVEDPRLSGMFLDCRPSKANKAFQMETQYIHSAEATDAKGERYVRIAPTQYPIGPDGKSELMNRLMVYNKKALWDGVKAWFEGGDPVDGTIDLSGACLQKFIGKVRLTWRIYGDHIPKNKRAMLNINSFISAGSTDATTFRLSWNSDLITKRETENGTVVTLPEYYHLVKTGQDSIGEWVAVAPEDVPAETGLHKVSFSRSGDRPPETFVTPEDEKSCWKNPGPVAGPFKAKLGDGSTVTYYWYRFADQPALLNADLTSEEREKLQKRVEKIHRLWTKDREYLPPPTTGKLADVDPALIVVPPAGLEVGYVPIVTRQEMEK